MPAVTVRRPFLSTPTKCRAERVCLVCESDFFGPPDLLIRKRGSRVARPAIGFESSGSCCYCPKNQSGYKPRKWGVFHVEH